MKKCFLLILSAAIFYAGCDFGCTFRVCDEPDVDRINALIFNFDLTATYTEADVDSAYIVRFKPNSNFTQPIDTHYFIEQFAQGNRLMVLSDLAPFSSGGMINLNSYEDYEYIIRANPAATAYKVQDIEVTGEYQDCDCLYVNTKKTFKLNGVDMTRTNSNLQITLN
jgi:hypothetical protein